MISHAIFRESASMKFGLLFPITTASPLAIALLLILGAAGCRDSKSGATNANWLDVSDRPADLADVERRAREADRKAVDDFFSQLSEYSGYITPETGYTLESQRAEVLPRLVELAGKSRITRQSVGAAIVLCRLQEPVGREHLLTVLDKGTTDQRTRALSGISRTIEYQFDETDAAILRFLLDEPQLIAAVKQQFDHPQDEVVDAALEAYANFHLPDMVDTLLDAAAKLPPERRELPLARAAQKEISPRLLQLALERDSTRPLGDNEWPTFTGLELCAESDDPAIRDPAREWLKRRLATWTPRRQEYSYGIGRSEIVEVLAETAQPGESAWLLTQFEKETDYARESLFLAWAKLEGPASRDRCLELARHQDPALRLIAIRAIHQTFAGQDDPELVVALTHGSTGLKDYQLWDVAQALKSLSGADARHAYDLLAPRLPQWERDQLEKNEANHSVDEIRAAIVEAGLLTSEEVARQKDIYKDVEDFTPTFENILDNSRATAWVAFDPEYLPFHYDSLVRDLAKASRGKFAPQHVSQEWHGADEEDYEADYTVRFILGNRAYQAVLRTGDEEMGDIEHLMDMVHRSLADNGCRERFLLLGDDLESGGTVIFGDPQVLKPLAARFGTTLTEYP